MTRERKQENDPTARKSPDLQISPHRPLGWTEYSVQSTGLGYLGQLTSPWVSAGEENYCQI